MQSKLHMFAIAINSLCIAICLNFFLFWCATFGLLKVYSLDKCGKWAKQQ